jgi:hypothetical protein
MVLSNNVITVTVIILILISLGMLMEVKVIPPTISLPLFLVLISIYMTILGLKSKLGRTPSHTYNLVWAGIMLSIGIAWLLLYQGADIIMALISVLIIVLVYVYLNHFKSRSIRTR